MAKYISIFFLTLMVSILLYFLFGALFSSENDVYTVVHMFGATIILFLSFIISLLFYMIGILKKK